MWKSLDVRGLAFIVILACFLSSTIAQDDDVVAETERLLAIHLDSLNGATLQASPQWHLRDQGKPQIILLGDSNTQNGFLDCRSCGVFEWALGSTYRGWAVLLNETLHHQAALVNMGVGGATTKWFNTWMPLWLEQLKDIANDVVLVNIMYGTNDAALPLQ